MARRALDPSTQAAIAGVLADPKFELIPLKNVDDQAAFLPAGATVSVTASPAKGIEATVELCERLQVRGFRVIPHLSARMIRDRGHLAELLARLDADGIEQAFVVGGDADRPGDFPDGLSLLRAMAEIGHRPDRHRRAVLPRGPRHDPGRSAAPGARRQAAVRAVHDHPDVLRPGGHRRLAGRSCRAAGITLPVWIGLPGVAELHKLMLISARIGVADSKRFLSKNGRLVGRLVRPGGYSPHGLLEGLAPALARPGRGHPRSPHLHLQPGRDAPRNGAAATSSA